MSQEILVPFSLTPSGGIAVTTDPSAQTLQHITSLVGTAPGERVMLTGYGVDTGAYLFAPDDDAVEAELISDVTVALNTWEPTVLVEGVTAIPDSPNDGQVAINVAFSQGMLPVLARTFTATILVGGDVIEDAVS